MKLNTLQQLTATVKAFGEVDAPDSDAAPYGSFEAVVSLPTLDRDGEVIDAGAFNPLPESIPILADHERRVLSLVARATPFYDGDALTVTGRFASHEFAQYVRELTKDGILDTMSVGLVIHEMDVIDGIGHITKAELLEASFVVVPSNRDAIVSAAKSANVPTVRGRDKMMVDVPPPAGSFEAAQEVLREALQEMATAAGGDTWVGLLATYSDRVVFSVESYPPNPELDGTYEAAYAISDTGVQITAPRGVQVTQVVEPKQSDSDEPEKMSDAQRHHALAELALLDVSE